MDGKAIAGDGNDPAKPVEQAAPLPLARRADFRLGAAEVRPSLRTVEGPGGTATLEPRVMQVLLAFADAGGAVLTRDDLFRICWNGVLVGDDSLNRAIAEVRRVARTADAGFGIETIPRIGYRLTGGAPADEDSAAVQPPADAPSAPLPAVAATRRWVVAGGAAAAAGALGLWAVTRPREDPRAAGLIERARQLRLDGLRSSDEQAAGLLREAVAIEPDNAAAWGQLAVVYSRILDVVPSGQATPTVRAIEQAAARALALDPREPNGLLAQASLRYSLDDWVTTERKWLEIAAMDPSNTAAIISLTYFLQSVGRNRDSWTWNERHVALEPMSPGPQWRRAFKHWILGRPREAIQLLDRALELWPRHPLVRNAGLVIFAFTDRVRSAMLMVEEERARPVALTPSAAALWGVWLKALDTRAPGDVAAARDAALAAAPRAPGLAAYGSMALGALGETDAAFRICDGFLLRRGPLAGPDRREEAATLINDPTWRRTQWLFVPATASLRSDARFDALCEGIGLARYWRQRGIQPDYKLV